MNIEVITDKYWVDSLTDLQGKDRIVEKTNNN